VTVKPELAQDEIAQAIEQSSVIAKNDAKRGNIYINQNRARLQEQYESLQQQLRAVPIEDSEAELDEEESQSENETTNTRSEQE
jgi:hypothetical protein